MLLFQLDERNGHPQEHLSQLQLLVLLEEGDDHPRHCLFLAVLPLTLPQFQGPQIASMKICLRVLATPLAMWWQL
jgi:hypothetical protein